MTGEPTLSGLAWRIAADVNRTVGGGLASIELMRRSMSARGWLNESSHGLLVAVSRFTPGTNVLGYCAGVGWMTHRATGVAVALVAASVPGSVAVTLLSAVVAQLVAWPLARMGLAVLTLVAAGLIASSAWALMRPHLGGRRRWLAGLLATGAVVLSLMGITPVRVLCLAAVWGALVARTGDEA